MQMHRTPPECYVFFVLLLIQTARRLHRSGRTRPSSGRTHSTTQDIRTQRQRVRKEVPDEPGKPPLETVLMVRSAVAIGAGVLPEPRASGPGARESLARRTKSVDRSALVSLRSSPQRAKSKRSLSPPGPRFHDAPVVRKPLRRSGGASGPECSLRARERREQERACDTEAP